MPGYKKKGDKEHKAARRREKREKRFVFFKVALIIHIVVLNRSAKRMIRMYFDRSKTINHGHF